MTFEVHSPTTNSTWISWLHSHSRMLFMASDILSLLAMILTNDSPCGWLRSHLLSKEQKSSGNSREITSVQLLLHAGLDEDVSSAS